MKIKNFPASKQVCFRRLVVASVVGIELLSPIVAHGQQTWMIDIRKPTRWFQLLTYAGDGVPRVYESAEAAWSVYKTYAEGRFGLMKKLCYQTLDLVQMLVIHMYLVSMDMTGVIRIRGVMIINIT